MKKSYIIPKGVLAFQLQNNTITILYLLDHIRGGNECVYFIDKTHLSEKWDGAGDGSGEEKGLGPYYRAKPFLSWVEQDASEIDSKRIFNFVFDTLS